MTRRRLGIASLACISFSSQLAAADVQMPAYDADQVAWSKLPGEGRVSGSALNSDPALKFKCDTLLIPQSSYADALMMRLFSNTNSGSADAQAAFSFIRELTRSSGKGAARDAFKGHCSKDLQFTFDRLPKGNYYLTFVAAHDNNAYLAGAAVAGAVGAAIAGAVAPKPIIIFEMRRVEISDGLTQNVNFVIDASATKPAASMANGK